MGLRRFDVVEKTTGKYGQAQFIKEPHIYEIIVKLSDGRKIITHLDCLLDDFDYIHYVCYVDAKAEKVLFDAGLVIVGQK